MKSIKPGRGPSMMGAFGSIAAGLFGIFWTVCAVNMMAPWYFAIFGVIFVCVAIVQAIYNFKNATGKNRFSEFDIVDEAEETDPMQDFLEKQSNINSTQVTDINRSVTIEGTAFCPYCGTKVASDFEFCSKCGKKLPD